MNESVTLSRSMQCSNLFSLRTVLIMLKRQQILSNLYQVCIMKVHMENTKRLCYVGTHRLLNKYLIKSFTKQ